MNVFSKLFKRREDGERPLAVRAALGAVLFLSLVFAVIKYLLRRGDRRNEK